MSGSPLLRQMPAFERNLAKLWRARTDADTLDGLAWYPKAHKLVCEWSEYFGLPIATVACIVSALSPQCEWSLNLIAADDVLHDRALSAYGPLPANVRKARAILRDKGVTTVPYFPYGPKVATFAVNLAGNYEVATIDTHALQAAFSDVTVVRSLHWTAYSIVSQAYVNAAHRVDVEPACFQAVLWHTWKRLYPRVSKIQCRTQWHTIGEF